jgi:hypothetical protein
MPARHNTIKWSRALLLCTLVSCLVVLDIYTCRLAAQEGSFISD